MQLQPKKVELVEGYGIFLSQPQLDAAVENGGTPTKLMRNLLNVFFSMETLAESSAYGSRGRPALDPDILTGCIGKLIHIMSTSQQSIFFSYQSNFIK